MRAVFNFPTRFSLKTLATLMILAGLAGSAEACSRYHDDWGGSDKAAHFGVSAALGVGASRLSSDPWTAFGLALAPGVAKEIYDSQQDCKRFSWKDLAWDAVGAYVGVRAGNWVLGPTGASYRLSF
jgi:uncharacterized protein YfiM (DUF2279 family)